MANLQGGLGEYVWDSDKNRFTSRIKNDGTEDRRFIADGQCSFLNGFISLTGYTPKDPDAYQQELLGMPNHFMLKGVTLVHNLKVMPPEMWATEVALITGEHYSSISEMLTAISFCEDVEREAKLTAFARFFGEELKRRKAPEYEGYRTSVKQEQERMIAAKKAAGMRTKLLKHIKTAIQKYLYKTGACSEYWLDSAQSNYQNTYFLLFGWKPSYQPPDEDKILQYNSIVRLAFPGKTPSKLIKAVKRLQLWHEYKRIRLEKAEKLRQEAVANDNKLVNAPIVAAFKRLETSLRKLYGDVYDKTSIGIYVSSYANYPVAARQLTQTQFTLKPQKSYHLSPPRDTNQWFYFKCLNAHETYGFNNLRLNLNWCSQFEMRLPSDITHSWGEVPPFVSYDEQQHTDLIQKLLPFKGDLAICLRRCEQYSEFEKLATTDVQTKAKLIELCSMSDDALGLTLINDWCNYSRYGEHRYLVPRDCSSINKVIGHIIASHSSDLKYQLERMNPYEWVKVGGCSGPAIMEKKVKSQVLDIREKLALLNEHKDSLVATIRDKIITTARSSINNGALVRLVVSLSGGKSPDIVECFNVKEHTPFYSSFWSTRIL